MKRIIFSLSIFIINITFAQTSIEVTGSANLDVGTGADVCVDNFVGTIGTHFTGGGTKCSGPLPVELVTFTATLNKNFQVELNWQTETEVNNYGFEVERSVILSLPACCGQVEDDIWQKIGFVKGSGNSNSPNDYSFVDKNLIAGKLKYRLKQIDTDGSFSFSPEVEVEIELPKVFSLDQNYPNPFGKTLHSDNPSTRIRWQSPVSGWQTLKVFDVLGREVATLVDEYREAGYHEIEFSVGSKQLTYSNEMASGIYFFQLQIGDQVQTKKMIFIR